MTKLTTAKDINEAHRRTQRLVDVDIGQPTAANINEAHRLAMASATKAVEYAAKCGRLLAAMKDQLGRGSFDGWVEKNCDFSRSTAYNYMRVLNRLAVLDDSNDTAAMAAAFSSIRAALGYESKPKPRPVSDSPKEAVSVVKAPGDGRNATEETGNDRPAASVTVTPEQRKIAEQVRESVKRQQATAAEKPEITPPPAFDFDGYEPEDDDDFRRNIENVLMADDKLAAMTDQLKQCHREIQALKASRDHYQSQAGEAVRLVKARDREIERLKRQIAKQAA